MDLVEIINIRHTCIRDLIRDSYMHTHTLRDPCIMHHTRSEIQNPSSYHIIRVCVTRTHTYMGVYKVHVPL